MEQLSGVPHSGFMLPPDLFVQARIGTAIRLVHRKLQLDTRVGKQVYLQNTGVWEAEYKYGEITAIEPPPPIRPEQRYTVTIEVTQ